MDKRTLFLALISFYTFVFFPLGPAWGQTLELPPEMDTAPPLIQHEPSTQTAPTGKDMAITATVTDNLAVKEAVLFYRPIGHAEYSSINMNPKGKNIYEATVPKQGVIEPGVEYYIQATDTAGNVVMRGFSFSPLVITVAPASPAPKTGGKEEGPAVVLSSPDKPIQTTIAPPSQPWYKNKWFWPVVGVIVVGVGIAAASGGDGGTPSTGTSGGQVTLVISDVVSTK